MAYSLTYSYDSTSQSYSVTGSSNITTSDNVVIPDKYDDGVNGEHPVTSIGIHAFEYRSLTSITIPDSVTSIGDSAFAHCSSLTSITIPDSVTSIDDYAFNDCTKLTSITIPDSVTSIGTSVFWNTAYYNNSNNWKNDVLYISKHLIKAKNTLSGAYTIKDGTLTIADNAFINCDSLTSITIPTGVTNIGDDAFRGCSSLTSVTIGNSVTSIGNNAFNGCTSLTSVTIPASVTSIGDDAFRGCSSLTSIIVDENNQLYKSIDGNLYSKDGTTFIEYSFGKTDTSFVIPDSVTSIGGYAFNGCPKLTSITIPDSVTSIGRYAFSSCDSLTSITIPDSITSIGEGAFSFCDSLTSVTIGNSVKNISDWAFGNCNSLKTIALFPKTPPTLASNAIPTTISTIYVPQSSKEAYKTATNWTAFAKKIMSDNLYLSFIRFNQKNKEYIDRKVFEINEALNAKTLYNNFVHISESSYEIDFNILSNTDLSSQISNTDELYEYLTDNLRYSATGRVTIANDGTYPITSVYKDESKNALYCTYVDKLTTALRSANFKSIYYRTNIQAIKLI